MNKTIASNKGLAALVAVAAALALSCVLGLLVSCAPKVADPSAAGQSGSSQDQASDTPIEWTQDIDCITCHTEEAATMTDAALAQANMHSEAGMKCVDCHTQTDVLAGAHEGVTYGSKVPTKATMVTVDAKTCQDPSCHGTMEDMAAKTSGSVVLVDSNGNEVNPHAYGENEQHLAHQPECTDCHKIHSDNTAKDATKWCAQCHHRGVFTCGNCHEIRERNVA